MNEVPEEEYIDEYFRKHKKKGKVEIVNAPHIPVAIADSHAHIHMMDNPALALARAGAHQVRFIEAITDTVEDGDVVFKELSEWQKQAGLYVRKMGSLCCGQAPYDVPKVRICAGVHPHNAKDYDDLIECQLLDSLKDVRVSAVGEVGLDFHYDLSPRDVQIDVFKRQIDIAKMTGLPIILHIRDAFDEGFQVLEEMGWPEPGVLLHCYTSDKDEVRRWVEKDCYVAFGGASTFASSDQIREAISEVPLDRLLLETDSPFMTPVPLRGEKCEPAHVVWTAQKVIEVLFESGDGNPVDQDGLFTFEKKILDMTYQNTLSLLDGAPNPWQVENA